MVGWHSEEGSRVCKELCRSEEKRRDKGRRACGGVFKEEVVVRQSWLWFAVRQRSHEEDTSVQARRSGASWHGYAIADEKKG